MEKRVGAEIQARGRRDEIDIDSVNKICSSFSRHSSKLGFPDEFVASRLTIDTVDYLNEGVISVYGDSQRSSSEQRSYHILTTGQH